MSSVPPTPDPVSTSCGLCSLTCWHADAAADTGAAAVHGGCPRGREARALLQSEQRLLEPTMLAGATRRVLGWPVAITTAASRLAECVGRHGPNSVAVLAAASLPLEASWLLRQLAQDGLDTTQVGSLSSAIRGGAREDLDGFIGRTTSTCTREDLDSADLIVLVGADPHRTHPRLAVQLERAVETGAHVVVLHSAHTAAVKHAGTWIDPRRGTLCAFLLALLGRVRATLGRSGDLSAPIEASIDELISSCDEAKVLGVTGTQPEDLGQLTARLCQAERVVAIYDLDDTTERSEGDLLLLAGLLAALGKLTAHGSGLFLLHAEANQAGIALTDLHQDLGPALDSGNLRGLLVVGEDPLMRPELAPQLRALDTLVVLDAHASLTARMADVVLPIPSLAESSGTLVACDGRLGRLRPSVEPLCGRGLVPTLNELARRLGAPEQPDELEAIRARLAVEFGMDPGHLEQLRRDGARWERRVVLGDAAGSVTPCAGCWPVLEAPLGRLQALIEARHRRASRKEAS